MAYVAWSSMSWFVYRWSSWLAALMQAIRLAGCIRSSWVAACMQVIIMGGCMGVGNTGPVVEFNIQSDPEAAHIVFEAGVSLTMVPLEVGCRV